MGLLRACGEGIVVATLAVTIGACDRVQRLNLSGEAMGTSYSVKFFAPASAEHALAEGVAAKLAEVDALMSTYRQDSELSRFNKHEGTDWYAVSGPLYTVVASALEVSRTSGGAFDITVGPLVNIWGFGTEERGGAPPPSAAVQRERERVGYENLTVRSTPPALRKRRADIYLDLSAIAKGYSVDVVAVYLSTQGVKDYMVEVGGELRAAGHNANDQPWRIGVEKPLVGARIVARIVPLKNMGMATSGGYRNFFEYAGVRYSHTLDPLTAAPITHNLAAVTVLHESAMQADAWATALLVMGPQRGFALAATLQIMALFVVADETLGFEEKSTPVFDDYLKTVH